MCMVAQQADGAYLAGKESEEGRGGMKRREEGERKKGGSGNKMAAARRGKVGRG